MSQLYCLCLRNTVASKCCLSTVWKPSALAWLTHSLTRGSQGCFLQLRPASPQPATETGRQCRGRHGVEASLHGVPVGCPVDTDTCPTPGFQLGSSACLALAQWCWMVTTSYPRVCSGNATPGYRETRETQQARGRQAEPFCASVPF